MSEQSIKQREQLETYPTDKTKPKPPDEGEYKVFMGDEQIKILEEADKNKIKVPSMPTGILDWTAEEEKGLIYANQPNAEPDNKLKRLQFKLSWVWQDWDALRNNERLITAINNVAEDKNSDEHYVKQLLVLFIDRLGKILGQTPIIEELVASSSE